MAKTRLNEKALVIRFKNEADKAPFMDLMKLLTKTEAIFTHPETGRLGRSGIIDNGEKIYVLGDFLPVVLDYLEDVFGEEPDPKRITFEVGPLQDPVSFWTEVDTIIAQAGT